MNPQRLSQVMKMLTLPVPAPRPPVAKPQDSFATLKVGQRLEQVTSFDVGTKRFSPGLLWEVRGVDSLGAYLICLTEDQGYVVRSREWKDKLFKRVRRPAKRKGQKS